jgi:hypothetical protein
MTFDADSFKQPELPTPDIFEDDVLIESSRSPAGSAIEPDPINVVFAMLTRARDAGMVVEVVATYGDLRAAGNSVVEASRHALREWDC